MEKEELKGMGPLGRKDIAFHMKWISDRIKQMSDAELSRLSLTYAQASILFFLEKRGGEATQKEIEDFLQVAHPTTVGLVSRMGKNGFVVCRPDQVDRRNKLVAMTEKAKAVYPEITSIRKRVGEHVMRGVSAKDKEELQRILSIMIQNISVTG